MTLKRPRTIFLFVFSVFLVVLSACETTLKKDMQPDMKDLKSITVFPFVCMDCTIPFQGPDGKVTETIGENASAVMTEHLVEKLRAKNGLEVIVMPDLDKEEINALYSGTLNVDRSKAKEAVCMGRIYHYKDRKGGNYSVSEPARVSFDMRIIRISDGQVLFFCDFDETQKPLSSNILNIGSFFKRKGRWVKAEEMALNAMDEALKDYFEIKP